MIDEPSSAGCGDDPVRSWWRRVRRASRTSHVALVVLAFAATPAWAQHDAHGDGPRPTIPPSEWLWRASGNSFWGLNYQQRKFRDFWAAESQNWLMIDRVGPLLGGRFIATSMWSLEPLTIQDLGSPQTFQTGETFDGAPLVDYQHPHDVVMGLGAAYDRRARGLRVALGAHLVGAPTIGPPITMHRPSASTNPAVPLSHHQHDSTHVSFGVITAGISRGSVTIEGSWFRGQEPDEHRFDLDAGALNSWATRVRFERGPWAAQASGGRLHSPEAVEPGVDQTRLSASVSYTGLGDRAVAMLVAWGRTMDVYGPQDAYLCEATWQVTPVWSSYARAESVAKNLLTAGGVHPQGFRHPHVFSKVGALTVGGVRELGRWRGSRVGVGADVTLHPVAPNVVEDYGTPVSAHAFVRVGFGSMLWPADAREDGRQRRGPSDNGRR